MEAKKPEKEDKPAKFYRFPEDELEDNIGDIESEMKNMLAYLDDVDGMMGNDDDLKHIKQIRGIDDLAKKRRHIEQRRAYYE